jgi:hypothetical protein
MCFDPEGQAQNLVSISKRMSNDDSSILDQNVFLRTPRSLENGDWDLLYTLNLFGLKHVLNDEFYYATYMKERLESQYDIAFENNDQAAMNKHRKHIELIERKTSDYSQARAKVEIHITVSNEENNETHGSQSREFNDDDKSKNDELSPMLSDG